MLSIILHLKATKSIASTNGAIAEVTYQLTFGRYARKCNPIKTKRGFTRCLRGKLRSRAAGKIIKSKIFGV